MKIRIELKGGAVTGTLNDSVAAQDFASLLPLTLTLEDYAKTEKISYLPRKLTITGAPAGATPLAGDICYYAPWGNLAVFYRAVEYSDGLVKLGVLDEDVAVLKKAGRLSVS